jgi:hypothetical protein
MSSVCPQAHDTAATLSHYHYLLAAIGVSVAAAPLTREEALKRRSVAGNKKAHRHSEGLFFYP